MLLPEPVGAKISCPDTATPPPRGDGVAAGGSASGWKKKSSTHELADGSQKNLLC